MLLLRRDFIVLDVLLEGVLLSSELLWKLAVLAQELLLLLWLLRNQLLVLREVWLCTV